MTERTGLESGRAAEAEAAVSRLGLASAARKAETAAAEAGDHAVAAILAKDIEFLRSVPSYARIHGNRTAALARSLDGIWPRSSPARPEGPEAALERCRVIAETMAEPEAGVAQRIGRMPQGDSADRVKAEARQVLDLEGRLSAEGVDPRAPGSSALGAAACALDDLYRDHRILSRAAAGEACGAAAARRDALSPLTGTAARLAELARLPDATPAQVALLAKWLAAAPRPWSAADDVPSETLAALEAEVEAREGATSAASALDAAHGTAWRSEEPGKLEAAARILADPGDARRPKAETYAEALGCPGGEASETLSRMARARLALRKSWPPSALSEAARHLPPEISERPAAAIEHLRALSAWRQAGAGETIRRLREALDGIDPVERERLLAAAPALMEGLKTIPPGRRKGALLAIASEFEAEAEALSAHVRALASFDEETCEAARRPAGHLRERRAALARLGSEEAYAELAGCSPEEVVEAMAWASRAAGFLPEGVDPHGRHAAALAERADEALEAAAEVVRMEAEARERTGEADPAGLVRAGRIALADIRLSEARAEVQARDGWGLVAWLESEGIEPELWGEALASRPVDEPEDSREPQPEARPAPTRVDGPAALPPGTLGWRRLRVVGPPQAALVDRVLA